MGNVAVVIFLRHSTIKPWHVCVHLVYVSILTYKLKKQCDLYNYLLLCSYIVLLYYIVYLNSL